MRRGRLAAVSLAAILAVAGAADASAADRPDLIVTLLAESTDSIDAGDTFLAADTTKNKGKKKSKASATLYTLSLDEEADPGDVELDSRGINGLRPGKSSTGVSALDVPGDTTSGAYHLLACADGGEVVTESKETNNCRVAEGTIQVQAPGCFAAAFTAFGGNNSGDLSSEGCASSPADAQPSCSPNTGAHQWWKYVVPASDEVTFSVVGEGGEDVGVAVYTGNSVGQELDCEDQEPQSTDPEVITITHTSGFPLTVFVQVFAYEPVDEGPYVLDITENPIP